VVKVEDAQPGGPLTGRGGEFEILNSRSWAKSWSALRPTGFMYRIHPHEGHSKSAVTRRLLENRLDADPGSSASAEFRSFPPGARVRIPAPQRKSAGATPLAEGRLIVERTARAGGD